MDVNFAPFCFRCITFLKLYSRCLIPAIGIGQEVPVWSYTHFSVSLRNPSIFQRGKNWKRYRFHGKRIHLKTLSRVENNWKRSPIVLVWTVKRSFTKTSTSFTSHTYTQKVAGLKGIALFLTIMITLFSVQWHLSAWFVDSSTRIVIFWWSFHHRASAGKLGIFVYLTIVSHAN